MLTDAGHSVVTSARNPAKAQELVKIGVEVRQGDITDKASMREAMRGADGVFHIAAWYKVGVKDKSPAQSINVGGTRNVLELMQELAIPRGVYTSTLAVFSDTHGAMPDETFHHEGPHLSEYDRTKWEAHYRVALPFMRGGLPLTIVMPGVVYGPGDTSSVRETFVHYLQRKLPMVPQQTAFCWAHVDDIAGAHILAMEKGRPGETYIIAGPPHTFVEALEMAEKITGIPAPKNRVSPGMMRFMAGMMGIIEKAIPLPETYTPESLRVLAGATYLGTNEKARRELGYNPRSLEVGLRETLEHEMRLLGIPLKN
jgi:nucleoside-diphosphate-sugar epimerase